MTSESPYSLLLDLPAGVLRQVLDCVSAADIVSLICACRQLKEVASEDVVWKPKFLKWHYRSARWQTDNRPWIAKYGARKEGSEHGDRGVTDGFPVKRDINIVASALQMEKEALKHFHKLCFMRTVFLSVRALRAMGEDVKDLLMHLALEEGCLKAGQRYWACFALRQVASRLSADSMRRLLAFDVQHSQRIEKGAILLAQIHNPMLDMSGIPYFLDKLAEELRRRLERRGCSDGPAALAVLSELLFGQPREGQEQPDEDNSAFESAQARHTSLAERLSQLSVPEEPYGLGLKGESVEYYRPDNSLLPYVLTARRGIPISLAIIHAAVAQRAGLRVECVGMPMHLVNKMGDQDSPEERFVDVFAGGALLTRREMRDMMHRLIDSFSPLYLQPMTLPELYQRMCMNLVHTYRAKQPPATPDILKCVLELLLALSDSPDLRQMHAKECDRLGDFEGVRDFLEYKSPGSSREGDMARALINSEQELAREHSRVIRRPSDGSVKHCVGQIMTHARYHYKGVIYGWDPVCRASEHWMQHMNVDSLLKGRYQPFYNVLVDSDDIPFQTTYVAQENIQPLVTTTGQPCLPVLHPEVDRYFEGRCEGASRYEPNTAVRHRYPDDQFDCDSAVCCGHHHQ